MYSRITVTLIAVAVAATSLFGAIPIHPIGPAEIEVLSPPPPAPLQHTKKTHWPRTLAELQGAPPLSGVVYRAALKSLGEDDESESMTSGQSAFISALTPSASMLGRSPFSVRPLAVPTFFETAEHNTTNNNGLFPAEPTTIAANSPTGTAYTVNAWVGYPNDSGIMQNFSTDRINYSPPFQLPRPAAYLDQGSFMGDPALSVTLTDGTFTPRIYAVAAAYHRTNSPSGQSGIYIYGSGDGGQTWQGAVEVAVSGDGNLLLDQPTVTTSWATSTNTVGMKFTAYALYTLNDRNQGAIRIRRSRSPIFCFTRCHAVCPCVPSFDNEVTVTTGNVASPQVAVDNNGAVHVTYVRYFAGPNGQSTIEEAVSDVPTDPSTTNISFGAPQVVANFYEVANDTINAGVRVITIPRMRYDAVADSIIITWHATGSLGGTITQVYFTSRPVSGSWPSPNLSPIFSVFARDLFMPGLDADESGNVLLGWYDRRDSGTNTEYLPYVAYVSSTGGLILGASTISGISSNPTSYFVGDYHEIWRHNYPDGARWNDAWIARPIGSNGDTYVTDVR